MSSVMALVCGACGRGSTDSPATPASAPSAAKSHFVSVSAVLPVSDYAAAVAWYAKWFGRDPDVVPDANVAEWMVAENAWIQVTRAPEHAGKSSAVIVVADLVAQRDAMSKAGIPCSEIQDYGIIKMCDVADPDGNKVNFVWVNPNPPPAK